MRALENLHEVFARNLGAQRSTYLRTVVDGHLASIDQLTYSEFIMSVSNPTCFNLLSAKPLEGEMILEISPSIIFPILDRLLGGGKGGETTVLDRALTEIEQNIALKIIGHALEQLRTIWTRVEKIDFRLEETESNPQLRQIVPPNEVVVVISFEVVMGEATGTMNLCIPFTVIEPLMPRFAIQNIYNFARRKPEERDARAISDGLIDCQIQAVAYLAEAHLSMLQLRNLRIGDVLRTDKDAQGPLLLTLEGKPKFYGRPTTLRNKKAFEVLSSADYHAHV